MRYLNIKQGPSGISEIALGAWRMGNYTEKEAAMVVEAAIESGINFLTMRSATEKGKRKNALGML